MEQVIFGRGSGRTERIIDESIKQLLEGKTLLIPSKKTLELDNEFDSQNGFEPKFKQGIPIIDHAWNKGHAQENMIQRMIEKLEIEHELRFKLGIKATKEKFLASGTLIISLKDLEKTK